jgi:polysaccharide deacetylase 2 family uncharacterized protein YibQ
MNPTELPTYPALQKMRAAFPDAAVFVELTQAIYSSGHEVNKYRVTVVIGDYACDAESDDAMDAADKCILNHATRDPKAEAIRKAKATLEAAGYTVKEGES